MAQIQSGIYLIKDVHGSWLEEKEGKNQGKSKKRSLAATELGQTLLPYISKSYLHFKALPSLHALWRFKLGGCSREKS